MNERPSSKFGAEVLLVFVGHSDDAKLEAKAVHGLEHALQRELEDLLQVASDASYKTVRMWEWTYDTPARVGGQDENITPELDRANVAVFVFKERIGKVTWNELERKRGGAHAHVMAFFPTQAPHDKMNDRLAVNGWADLLAKQESMTEDWEAAPSVSLTPMEKYRDASHLGEIAFKRLKRTIAELLRPFPQRDSEAAPKASTSFIGENPHLSFDRRPVDHNIAELDKDLLTQFLDRPLSQDSIGKHLGILGGTGGTLVQRMEILGCACDGHPTVGGFLCFAPRAVLATRFGSCSLHMVVYGGTRRGERTAEIYTPQGNLLELYQDGMEWLTKNAGLRRRGRVGYEDRDELEIPEIVLREALANALVHRDYETDPNRDQPTRVEVYADRIEITSFGRLPESVSLELLNSGGEKIVPVRRNPVIARVFLSMTYVELNASGVPRMRLEMEKASLALPRFTQDLHESVVRVILVRPADWAEGRRRRRGAILDETNERRRVAKVFVASPCDVAEEREVARRVIAELDRNLGASSKCRLEACGWEDRRPGLGRAQGLINPLVEEADLLVGILWGRFGTQTGVAESGTREELDIMLQRAQQGEAVDVMMYFRDVHGDMLADPGPQLPAVLAFRKQVESVGLYQTYASPEEFAQKLRAHLTAWVSQRLGRPARRPRGHASRPGPSTAFLMDRFLKSQAAEHSYLPMAGFETRMRFPVELENVLVPLRARLATGRVEQGGGKESTLEPSGDDAVVDFERVWQRARERKVPTLVVLGQPGSGKTTLLKHLLLRCATDPQQLGLRPGTVPLLLPLREVRPAEDLAAAVRRILKTDRWDLPQNFFAAPLFAGEVLLLLDGLDEVVSAKARNRVARWIEEQRQRFAECPIVVTARFAGYTGEARLDSPHLEVSLERFREPEIRAFLERWFVTVETVLGEHSEFYRQKGLDIAADLFARIAGAPEIFALATNPLMLQIIALVHRDRGALPDRRVELYDECTNVLLEHWDRAKKGLNLPLTAKEARRVLQPVAHWMHQVPERRFASARELMPLVRDGLSEFPKKKVDPQAFLTTVRDRSGLFTGYGTDEYGFQHLSFQEYLTACEVRRQESYGELVQVYGETWWREVTRLLMALDNPSCFEPFMRLLVASDRFLQHHELTAACIHDAFEASARPFAAALEAALKERQQKGAAGRRQYQLLLALRELPPEKLGKVQAALESAATAAQGAQARALAAGLLQQLGIERAAEIDPETSLPRVRVKRVDGSELVLIPAGAFQAGYEDERDNRPRQAELPSFYLARYPVTNAQYAEFLKANPEAAKPEAWDNERFNQPQQPVVGVSWHDAKAYCDWAALRLPTEWEWEKGARGTDGRRYPWGDRLEPDETHANFGGKVGQPTPVGSYPAGASPYGLLDMAGNVWEWTESWYSDGEKNKTVRGGSFDDDALSLRAGIRSVGHPDLRLYVVGFRCAQDP